MNTKWKKVVQDLIANRARTILVILAISLGVFGIGLILNSYTITKREMNKSYQASNPSSFSIRIDNITDELIEELSTFKEIENLEVRRTVRGRCGTESDEWTTIMLYVIDDFNNVGIDRFFPEEGSHIPATGEILLERKAISVAGVSIGDDLTTKIALSNQQALTVSGSVYAPGLKPAWMEGIVYGFITEETLALLGKPIENKEIRFTVSGDKSDEAYIREVAFGVRDYILEKGFKVDKIEVPVPGEHPNAAQMYSILFLFQVFGILSLLLSVVLVINIIYALLNSQKKQIAIMKATGATNKQLAAMYYTFVIIIGSVALLFAIPAATSFSMQVVDLLASTLNYNIASKSIPMWSYFVQIAAGLLVPTLAATYPIIHTIRVPVNAILQDSGIKNSRNNRGRKIYLPFIKTPLLVSLRNTFRRPLRFLFSVTTLAVGGAILIMAINVRTSLRNTFDVAINSLNYDITVMFSRNYTAEDINAALEETNGIKSIDYFAGGMSYFEYEDGTSGNTFRTVGVPYDTDSFDFPILEGRWLTESDTDSIVINQGLLAEEPEIKIGDTVTLVISKKKAEFTVVGIAKEVGGGEKAYISRSYYQNVFQQAEGIRLINIRTEDEEVDTVAGIRLKVEMALREAGLDVLTSITEKENREVMDNHLFTVAGFLIIASIMVISVGIMGLISTTGINVIERMREIGIMRSLGAKAKNIIKIFVIEGLLTGFISWIVAIVIALPFSFYIGNTFGAIFLDTTLDNVINTSSILLWLVLITVISVAVSIITAQPALKASVNEVLNYE